MEEQRGIEKVSFFGRVGKTDQDVDNVEAEFGLKEFSELLVGDTSGTIC